MLADPVLYAIDTRDLSALGLALGAAWNPSTHPVFGLQKAASIGWLEGLVLLHQRGAPLPPDLLRRAASGGAVAVVRYLHQNGFALAADALECACEGGHVEVVRYLHENGLPLRLSEDRLMPLLHRPACDLVVRYLAANGAAPTWVLDLARLAQSLHSAASADLEETLQRTPSASASTYLTWFLSRNPTDDKAVRALQLLHDLQRRSREWMRTAVLGDRHAVSALLRSSALLGPEVIRTAFRLSAANGRTDLVRRFVESSDVVLDLLDACCLAAGSGRTAVVEYLHSVGLDLASDEWRVGRAAALGGHLETLRTLHRVGLPLSIAHGAARRLAVHPDKAELFRFIAENGGGEELRVVNEIAQAICTQDIGRVESALSRLSPAAAPRELLELAAKRGSADMVVALMRAGVDVRTHGAEAIVAAAARGKLETVRLLHEHGADIAYDNRAALRVAAESGQLEIVEYLNRNGVPLSPLPPETLDLVALNGHLDVQLYLTRGGCTAIGTQEAPLRTMIDDLASAPPVFQPSRVWQFFSAVNMEQLRSAGIGNFKRTLSQNYFTFLPTSNRDPQLVLLREAHRRRASQRRWRITFPDPDRQYSDRGQPVPNEIRVFRDEATGDSARRFVSWQHRHRLALYRELLELVWEEARARDSRGLVDRLCEPRLGNALLAWSGRRPVSQDLAHSILEANSILEGRNPAPGVPLRILEIGAGYGRLAHVLVEAVACTYVVVDIPPALLISQWYLRQVFPMRRVFEYRPFDDFESVREEFEASDIAFLLASQVEALPDGYVDLAINISSLHELRPEQIAHTLSQMYRVSREDVYIKQYREYPNPWDEMTIREDAYTVPDDWTVVFDRGDVSDGRFFERLVRRRIPGPRCDTKLPPGKSPRVSLLIANFDHGHYLRTSLEAALAQTRPFDEIIVVDDGSTDDSAAVVASFQSRCAALRFVPLGRNLGQHHAIQRALVESTGDYIVWAASDDLLLPTFLEISLEALAKHPDCGLVFSRLSTWVDGTCDWLEYNESNHGAAFDLGRTPLHLTPHALDELLSHHYLWISGNTVLARRAAVIEMGGFKKSLRWHADWFGYYAIALRFGVVGIPQTLGMMRERPGTYSNTGMNNPDEQRNVLRAVYDNLLLPENHDLAQIFRHRPSLVSLFGRTISEAASGRLRYVPFYWPLLKRDARAWRVRVTAAARRRLYAAIARLRGYS